MDKGVFGNVVLSDYWFSFENFKESEKYLLEVQEKIRFKIIRNGKAFNLFSLHKLQMYRGGSEMFLELFDGMKVKIPINGLEQNVNIKILGNGEYYFINIQDRYSILYSETINLEKLLALSFSKVKILIVKGKNEVLNLHLLENFKYVMSIILNNVIVINDFPILPILRKISFLYCEFRSDIRFHGVINLKYLKIFCCGIKSFGNILILKKLKSLNLSSNNITDLNGLERLRDLKTLNLCNNKIGNVSFKKKLKKLKALDLSCNSILNLDFCLYIPNVSHLDLQQNSLNNIHELRFLKKLKILNLGMNNIENLKPLKSLRKIRELRLFSNEIKDLKYLADYKKLKKLDIAFNPIKNLIPFAILKYLTHLSTDNLGDYSVMAELKKLEYINFDFNVLELDQILFDVELQNNSLKNINTNLGCWTQVDFD